MLGIRLPRINLLSGLRAFRAPRGTSCSTIRNTPSRGVAHSKIVSNHSDNNHSNNVSNHSDNNITETARNFLHPEPIPSREKRMNIVIRAMKNNTFLHLTTPQGGLVYTVTAKNSGARGTGKSTIKEGTCLAVSRLARRIRRLLSAREEDFIEKIKKKHQITRNLLEMGFHVRISGPGVGRVPALLELSRMGLNFDRLTEETRLKHGGNRARKPRRT